MKKEIRNFDNIEFRAIEDNDKKYIEGYAFKFNTLSKDLGGFFETIDSNSIDENTDLTDVVALFNHNINYVLARKNSEVNTLEIKVDETGLYYRFEVDNDISYVNDLWKNIQKKNINKSSFAFRIAEDGESWERKDDKYIRRITRFLGIYDVSPVTNPAYDDTSVRNFDEIKSKLDNDDVIYDNNNIYDYKYKFLKLLK